MKTRTCSIWLVLALALGAGAEAQTFNESAAAYRQGNYATAIAGFRKLAERGDAAAQFYLGVMYANGRGVAKDERQAVFWYRKAAEQGDADAQLLLGKL